MDRRGVVGSIKLTHWLALDVSEELDEELRVTGVPRPAVLEMELSARSAPIVVAEIHALLKKWVSKNATTTKNHLEKSSLKKFRQKWPVYIYLLQYCTPCTYLLILITSLWLSNTWIRYVRYLATGSAASRSFSLVWISRQ